MTAAVRTREFYPARMINGQLVGMPGIFAQTGADPADGITVGWLRSYADDLETYVRNQGGSPDEVAAIRVFGTEHLRASYVDILTTEEQLQEELQAARLTLSRLKSLFYADGTPVPNLVAELRVIVGA